MYHLSHLIAADLGRERRRAPSQSSDSRRAAKTLALVPRSLRPAKQLKPQHRL